MMPVVIHNIILVSISFFRRVNSYFFSCILATFVIQFSKSVNTDVEKAVFSDAEISGKVFWISYS